VFVRVFELAREALDCGSYVLLGSWELVLNVFFRIYIGIMYAFDFDFRRGIMGGICFPIDFDIDDFEISGSLDILGTFVGNRGLTREIGRIFRIEVLRCMRFLFKLIF
jgi:hypothetical protein